MKVKMKVELSKEKTNIWKANIYNKNKNDLFM